MSQPSWAKTGTRSFLRRPTKGRMRGRGFDFMRIMKCWRWLAIRSKPAALNARLTESGTVNGLPDDRSGCSISLTNSSTTAAQPRCSASID